MADQYHHHVVLDNYFVQSLNNMPRKWSSRKHDDGESHIPTDQTDCINSVRLVGPMR